MFHKEKAQYCPGEVCDVKLKHDIQKTSKVQMLILLGLIAYIVVAVILFNGNFSKRPYDLFGMYSTSQSK